jgi:tRNA(Arg) A34 adenosine deaminase TadA
VLCVGAASLSTVGRIRFAAADPWGGSDRTIVDNPHTRRWPVALEGPLEGRPGRLSWG